MMKKQFLLLSLLVCPLSYQSTAQASVKGAAKVLAYLTALTATAAGAEAYGFNKGREFEKLPEDQRPESPLAYVAITTAEDALLTASKAFTAGRDRLEKAKATLFPQQSVAAQNSDTATLTQPSSAAPTTESAAQKDHEQELSNAGSTATGEAPVTQ